MDSKQIIARIKGKKLLGVKQTTGNAGIKSVSLRFENGDVLEFEVFEERDYGASIDVKINNPEEGWETGE